MQYSSYTLKVILTTIPGIITSVNNGKRDGKCKVGGQLGVTLDLILSRLMKKYPSVNCTIDQTDAFGTFDETTRKYSGVIGALLSGAADIPGRMVSYPITDDNGVIEYSTLTLETTMTILSLYNKSISDGNHASDILFMFHTIPVTLWFSLALSFLSFVFVLEVGRWLIDRREKSDSLWITVCAFLDQDNFPAKRAYIVLLSLIMSIGIFFAVSFLRNNVSTDLVVLEAPVIIKDYDDIINRHVSVIASRKIPEMESFKSAPAGSKLWKIYQKFVWPEIEGGKGTLMRLQQDPVLIGHKGFILYYGYFAFGAKEKDHPNVRALIVQDPSAEKFTRAYVFRKDIPKHVSSTIRKIQIKYFEHGLALEIEEKIPKKAASMLTGFKPSTERKFGYKVEQDESEYFPIGIKNIVLFIETHLVLMVIAFITLMAELFFKQRFPRTKVKARRKPVTR